jgi:hypothetical protein
MGAIVTDCLRDTFTFTIVHLSSHIWIVQLLVLCSLTNILLQKEGRRPLAGGLDTLGMKMLLHFATHHERISQQQVFVLTREGHEDAAENHIGSLEHGEESVVE